MTLTIGVVIPCYKPHIGLLKRMLDSIEAQTKKPDMVIVSCSSSEESDNPYKQSDYSYPLKIYTHRTKKNIAQNKNFGTRLIQTDIITYIDADDIMHPQRIEIIYNGFIRNPNLKLLLTSFRLNPTDLTFPIYDTSKIKYEIDPFYVCQWGAVNLIHNNERHKNNSHSSIRNEVLCEQEYIENEEGYGREDTLFNARFINNHLNQQATGFVDCELTWYYPSSTKGHDTSTDICNNIEIKSNLTIGIVIPCYKPHINLLKKCLDSIETQTKKPDMVIVSCSSSEESDIPYKSEDYSYPLKIYTHSGKRNTAQNKNFGSQFIGTDIITYFDSDDVMHPQRIEIIYNAFINNSNFQLILHNFRRDPTDLHFPYYDVNKITYEIDPFYISNWGGVCLLENNSRNIHNGHISITKNVFLNEQQFNESSIALGREDTDFNTMYINTHKNEGKIGFIDCELTWYYPSYTDGHK